MSIVRLTVVCALGLTGLAAVVFVLSQVLERERTTREVVRQEVQRVVVRAQGGEVTLRAGVSTAVLVERHERWLLQRPTVRSRIDGDALLLDAECARLAIALRCGIDLVVTVPPHLDVRVEGEATDVRLRGLQGRVVARTEAGDVVARRLEPVTFEVRSDAGDLDLDLIGRPARVQAFTEQGDIHVVVPYGTYRVDAASESGATDIAGVLRDDLAPQRVVARTDAGDITVRAR